MFDHVVWLAGVFTLASNASAPWRSTMAPSSITFANVLHLGGGRGQHHAPAVMTQACVLVSEGFLAASSS